MYFAGSRRMSEARSTGRPITADDLFNLRLVSDPQLSPDGSLVTYVVTRLDKPVLLLHSPTRAVQSIMNRCLRPSGIPLFVV